MPSSIKPHCNLDARASLSSPTTLQLYYRVQNTSDHVLFLVNRFWTSINDAKSFQVQPNMVNVQVNASRVTIGKAVVPVPDDREVEYHYTPCLSWLGPREIYEETLEIALPLVPFTWYEGLWDLPAPASEGPLRPLYFELGYLAVEAGRASAIRAVATSHGLAYSRNIEPEDQLLVCAGPLLPDVAVADNHSAL